MLTIGKGAAMPFKVLNLSILNKVSDI